MSCPPRLCHFLVFLTARPLTRPGRYYAALGVTQAYFPTHGEVRRKFAESERALLREIEIISIKEITSKEMHDLDKSSEDTKKV